MPEAANVRNLPFIFGCRFPLRRDIPFWVRASRALNSALTGLSTIDPFQFVSSTTSLQKLQMFPNSNSAQKCIIPILCKVSLGYSEEEIPIPWEGQALYYRCDERLKDSNLHAILFPEARANYKH